MAQTSWDSAVVFNFKRVLRVGCVFFLFVLAFKCDLITIELLFVRFCGNVNTAHVDKIGIYVLSVCTILYSRTYSLVSHSET